MPFQQRTTLACALAGLIALAFYLRAYSPEASPQDWAWLALQMIGLGILLSALLTIAATVFHALLSGERKAHGLVDERDRMLELRGQRVAYALKGVLFIGVIAALAWGWPVVPALNLLLLGGLAGELFGSLLILVAYWRSLAP